MKLTKLEHKLDAVWPLDKHLPKRDAHQQITNLTQFRNLVVYLRDIPGLDSIADEIEKTPVFSSRQETMRVADDIRIAFDSAVQRFASSIIFLRQFLPSLGATAPESDQIYVTFSKSNDLLDLAKNLSDLGKALQQTILVPEIGGKTEIKAVENGSIIIVLSLGTVAAVGVVARLAWAAAVIYNKVQEGRMAEQHIQSLKMNNETLSQIRSAQLVLINKMVEAEARHLDKEIFGGEESPDRLERVKFAIKTIEELVEKGAKVQPAVKAPEDVKALFPDFENLSLVQSKIKQIAEKSED